MDNENSCCNLKFDTETIPLAYHEMCMVRHEKKIKHLSICWAVSIIVVVISFCILWMQYDYVSTEEYTGVYTITDSQGNVISSDLSTNDVIRIIQELESGKG